MTRVATRWVSIGIVVAVLAGGCSDDSDGSDPPAGSGDTDEVEVVATVDGRDVTLAEIEVLATDAGFLDLVKQDEPSGDLAASGAGRAALGRLIAERAVAAALDGAGIEVSDEVRGEAEDAIGDASEVGDDARAVLVDGLAEYLTFDRALRDGSGGSTLDGAAIVERFPALTTEYCGPSLAVEPDAAEAVDAAVASGVGLTDVEVADGLVATTGDGLAECGLEVGIPAAARPVIVGVPDGEIAKATARRTETGETVVVYARPTENGPGDDEAVERATKAFDERLRASGHTAWWDTVGPQLEVTVEPEWGVWAGTRLLDEAAEPELVEVTASTTTAPPTTVAPTTTTPPGVETPPAGPTLSEQVFAVADPGTADHLARGDAALASAVPAAWREAIPVTFTEIAGTTSLSYDDGTIELGTYHLTGTWEHLQDVTAHEFGHQIAYDYGTQAELGAAPEGWPISGSTPVERWADCVARSFSGIASGSHGMTPCDGESYTWTYDWLAPGPSAHPRTR